MRGRCLLRAGVWHDACATGNKCCERVREEDVRGLCQNVDCGDSGGVGDEGVLDISSWSNSGIDYIILRCLFTLV